MADKQETIANAAAMRTMLCRIKGAAKAWRLGSDTEVVLDQIIRYADAALAAPPRNCDVGTAEEQTKRFYDYCDKNACIDCPLLSAASTNCRLAWAQMPYTADAPEKKCGAE